jgi:hypothetical protein
MAGLYNMVSVKGDEDQIKLFLQSDPTTLTPSTNHSQVILEHASVSQTAPTDIGIDVLAYPPRQLHLSKILG